MPLVDLRGREVLAVAAVGDPRAFASQLEAAGARVRLAAFPDHHAFTAADVDRLGAAAASVSVVVCTLKDAVKLGPLWARAAAGPLWYVSQRVELERGASELDRALAAALSARS